MSLSAGRKLGPYEILAPIGVGGMGEVYRARDTKLGRDVAIKVLPESFAEDKERLARFQREARLFASLNHPNIATLFDLQESDGLHFLVMELVPGETLAERGLLTIDEALPVFKQIAEALEAAHANGVIHRDLKPANIKVTPKGKVKVLDFGLAKAMEPEAPVADSSQSPTLTKGTALGAIMGTAAYMSPEQARGKPIDKRTDIWAFGCCLYEVLTGRKAFEGETVTDTLASVVNKEPAWDTLPEALDGKVRHLVRRCLRKDVGKRLRDIGDAGLEIEEALAEPAVDATSQRREERLNAPVFVAVLIGGIALGMALRSVFLSPPAAPPDVSHLSIALSPPMQPFNMAHSLAISPDGRHLVYVGADETSQLYLRPLSEPLSTPILGTEGAKAPYVSPDGKWVAFVAEGRLKKVSLEGGTAMDLCPAPDLRGAVWGKDGFIYYSPDSLEGLWKVSEAGGAPERLTQPDTAAGEASHRTPELLPDGETLLFMRTRGMGGTHLAKLSLRSGDIEEVFDQGSRPRYAVTGHLVQVLSGSVVASPFDVRSKKVLAPAVPVLEAVHGRAGTNSFNFDFSPTGTMVYVSAQDFERSLVVLDRQENSRPLGMLKKPSGSFAISPDGRRVAARIDRDLWIYEVERGTLTKFTHGGTTGSPCWSPDGQHLAFMLTEPKAVVNIFTRPIDGSRDAEMILDSPYTDYPDTWSPDGREIVFRRQTRTESGWDLWKLPLDGAKEPEPFIASPFNETRACFSPDGRWVAFQADESGRDEVYIHPFPGPGAKLIVSTDGGSFPAWSQAGKELFYRNGNKLMVVPIQLGHDLVVGQPEMLFEGPYYQRAPGVMPNGRQFVMIREEPLTHVNIVLNWFEELKRLVPVN